MTSQHTPWWRSPSWWATAVTLLAAEALGAFIFVAWVL